MLGWGWCQAESADRGPEDSDQRDLHRVVRTSIPSRHVPAAVGFDQTLGLDGMQPDLPRLWVAAV